MSALTGFHISQRMKIIGDSLAEILRDHQAVFLGDDPQSLPRSSLLDALPTDDRPLALAYLQSNLIPHQKEAIDHWLDEGVR